MRISILLPALDALQYGIVQIRILGGVLRVVEDALECTISPTADLDVHVLFLYTIKLSIS